MIKAFWEQEMALSSQESGKGAEGWAELWLGTAIEPVAFPLNLAFWSLKISNKTKTPNALQRVVEGWAESFPNPVHHETL